MTTTAPLPNTVNLPTAPSGVRIAYLLSRYPAVSHSFFLNEILQLKNLGFDIEVASINDPDRAIEALSWIELNESRKTYYIKSASFAESFGIILRTLLLRPGVFSGPDLRIKFGRLEPPREAIFCVLLCRSHSGGRLDGAPWPYPSSRTFFHSRGNSWIADVGRLENFLLPQRARTGRIPQL